MSLSERSQCNLTKFPRGTNDKLLRKIKGTGSKFEKTKSKSRLSQFNTAFTCE